MLDRLLISRTERAALTDRIISRAWSTSQVGIILGALLLLYILASFVGIFFREDQIPLVQLAVTLLIYFLLTVLIICVNRRCGNSWSERYGMDRSQLKKLLLSPLIYLTILPLLILTAKGWHLLLQRITGTEIELQQVAQAIIQNPAWLQVLYILTAVLVTPFFEETVFRGLLLPYLAKQTGLGRGILGVSVLFAAMHYHLPSFVPLLLLSVVLCLAYWRTGSLWVVIGMHAIFNAVSILALHSGG